MSPHEIGMIFPEIFEGHVLGFFTTKSLGVDLQGLTGRKVYTPLQEHTGTVIELGPDMTPKVADAVITDRLDVLLGVKTADCVPILLYHPGSRTAAAVHAGWRGSAAAIAARVADALGAGSLLAAIGPHIGPCCYEVDDPVRERIRDASVFVPAERPRHYMLDLFELNRRQLVECGVRAVRIERVGGCTACDSRYYSYRRDGTGGRMLHWIRA